MRCVLAVLIFVFSGYVFGAEGPRVPIEDTGASVEHPMGWTLMPASGSPPVVMFNLCDSAMSDGCLVRGEMTLAAPNMGREAVPLKDRLEAATARQQKGVPLPRIWHSGRYDAIETFWQGEHSSHIKKQVIRGDMQIETPAGFYECMLTADPDRFESQIELWRRFCASLELATNIPD